MLARGELRAVGATTLDEYRKHIEKDAALERRFQPVCRRADVEDTIAILRGLKERYEVHHGVRINDAALVAAATLSRPLHRRPLPARQGDRPDRRGGLATARSRSTRCRPRSTRSQRRDPAARDRGEALKKETRRRLEGAARGAEAELAELRERAQRDEGALAEREGGDRRDQGGEGAARGGRPRGRAGRARGRPGARRRAALRRDPRAARRRSDEQEARLAELHAGTAIDADRRGDRGGHRRGRRQMDRDPGQPR